MKDTTNPRMITEIHRYSKPENMWSFSKLEPDTTFAWNVQPFAPLDIPVDCTFDRMIELGGPTYAERGLDCFHDDNVEAHREALKAEGFEPVVFAELPESFKAFVTAQQAPLEWQSRLAQNDAEVTSRIQVWVLGQFPTTTKEA